MKTSLKVLLILFLILIFVFAGLARVATGIVDPILVPTPYPADMPYPMLFEGLV